MPNAVRYKSWNEEDVWEVEIYRQLARWYEDSDVNPVLATEDIYRSWWPAVVDKDVNLIYVVEAHDDVLGRYQVLASIYIDSFSILFIY